MTDPCEYVHHHGDWLDQPSYCESDAAEGQPYCAEHGRLAEGE